MDEWVNEIFQFFLKFFAFVPRPSKTISAGSSCEEHVKQILEKLIIENRKPVKK